MNKKHRAQQAPQVASVTSAPQFRCHIKGMLWKVTWLVPSLVLNHLPKLRDDKSSQC